jgi:hypothetical protein
MTGAAIPLDLLMTTQSLTHDLTFVNFDNGDQTELTANMIAKSLYLQCDQDGNQYVLLEKIVDHQCLLTAVKLPNQKISLSTL